MKNINFTRDELLLICNLLEKHFNNRKLIEQQQERTRKEKEETKNIGKLIEKINNEIIIV